MTHFNWGIHLVNGSPRLMGDCVAANGDIMINQPGGGPGCRGVSTIEATLSLHIENTSFFRDDDPKPDIFSVSRKRSRLKEPYPALGVYYCPTTRTNDQEVEISFVLVPRKGYYNNFRVSWWHVNNAVYTLGQIDPKIKNGPPALHFELVDIVIGLTGLAVLGTVLHKLSGPLRK